MFKIKAVTGPADEETKSRSELGLDSVSPDLIESISTHAIFRVDAEGHIQSWSDSAQSLYGYEAAGVAHQDFSELFADREGPNPDIEAVLSAAKTGAEEIELWN